MLIVSRELIYDDACAVSTVTGKFVLLTYSLTARGVTIHRYIDTMYDDTMHRCHASNIDICSIKTHLYFGTVHIFMQSFSFNLTYQDSI